MKTPAEMGFNPRVTRMAINDLPNGVLPRISACDFCPLGHVAQTSICIHACGPNYVFFDPVIYATKRLEGKT